MEEEASMLRESRQRVLDLIADALDAIIESNSRVSWVWSGRIGFHFRSNIEHTRRLFTRAQGFPGGASRSPLPPRRLNLLRGKLDLLPEPATLHGSISLGSTYAAYT